MFDLFDENGRYKLNNSYQEILKLDRMLSEARIPHTIDNFMDGWQIVYPCNGVDRIMDAIEHFGSYGHEDDLLEIMGLLTPEEAECDSVSGCLTAEDVFDRIKNHYEKFVNAIENGLQ